MKRCQIGALMPGNSDLVVVALLINKPDPKKVVTKKVVAKNVAAEKVVGKNVVAKNDVAKNVVAKKIRQEAKMRRRKKAKKAAQ